VASEVRQTDAVRHRDRIDARTQVGREAIASTLVEFYRPTNGYIAYSANVERGPVHTSILTRPEWLDLRLPLGRGFDRAILSDGMDVRPLGLEEIGAQAAVHRVAHVLATGGRMANASLYSLRHIGFEDQGISVELGVTDFLSYALTLDLLEAELVDAISAGTPEAHAALPLRQRYLPDLAAVTDLEHRVCSGGPVAVFAAARRRSRSRPDRGDYVFLVQQRSAHTLNANRRLAVIPKAFHQPLIDFSDDAQLSATLEREMEEELFGRADLDGAGAGHRQADPLHLTRLSPPMRALMDHTDAWHVECTGFGLNLVSGNYEFACLIVVEDEDWWGEYGGSIEANWEAEGLQRFSTLDREAVARLVQNESWSNEALFALLQGLRRLADTGGPRVEPPTIALES
jgi:hypothetical protein